MFFAIVHVASVLVVFMQNYEGSWGYVLFVLPDLPVMLSLVLANMLVPMSPISSWVAIGVFGSIWWYLIGSLLQRKWSISDKWQE